MSRCEHDQNACTLTALYNNAYKHAFRLIGTINNIVDVVMHRTFETDKQFYDTAYEFGTDLGKIASSIFGL